MHVLYVNVNTVKENPHLQTNHRQMSQKSVDNVMFKIYDVETCHAYMFTVPSITY